jgi:hypothetical protein
MFVFAMKKKSDKKKIRIHFQYTHYDFIPLKQTVQMYTSFLIYVQLTFITSSKGILLPFFFGLMCVIINEPNHLGRSIDGNHANSDRRLLVVDYRRK